jgi:hypothetical protein
LSAFTIPYLKKKGQVRFPFLGGDRVDVGKALMPQDEAPEDDKKEDEDKKDKKDKKDDKKKSKRKNRGEGRRRRNDN